MATKIRIELNHDGIRQLLCSSEIAAECEKAAKKISDYAGDGFEVKSRRVVNYGGGRVSYGVAAETYEAKLAEAEDKALSVAVSQCRL